MLGIFLITILVSASTGLKRIQLQKDVIDVIDPTTSNLQQSWGHSPIQPMNGYNHQPSWNWKQPQQQKSDWNQQQQTSDWNQQQETSDWNQQQKTSDWNQQQKTWNWNQQQPWKPDQQLTTWDNLDEEQKTWHWNQQQPEWDWNHWDWYQEQWHWPKEYMLLKISLSVWDQVEERFRVLLLSAVKNSDRGLWDPSIRAAGVMFTVAKLAAILARDCSQYEYARTYQQIVHSNLIQNVKSPQIAIHLMTKLLNAVSRNTEKIRELLNAKTSNGKAMIKGLKKLEKEKDLVFALGTLAFGAFSSYPLKKAIRDDEVIQYMMGPNAQDKLYPLVVKTAQVLQLLSNTQTCELEDTSELGGELDDDDTSDNNYESSIESYY